MSSEYADEGSVAHELAALCLKTGTDAAAYIGRIFKLEDYEHSSLSPSGAHRWMRCTGSYAMESRLPFKPRTFGEKWPVTADMARDVQTYVDQIREIVESTGGDLLIEQKLDTSEVFGVPGFGTGDAIILVPATRTMHIRDLKFGRGVLVDAEENEQMMSYGGAARRQYEAFGDFDNFVLAIHQPRTGSGAPSEWPCTLERLLKFEADALAKATEARAAREWVIGQPLASLPPSMLVPGDKQCLWCEAKATCPALAKAVQDGIGLDFDDLDAAPNPESIQNARMMVKGPASAEDSPEKIARDLRIIPLVEMWCEARAAHAEAEILRGEKIPGFKAVIGKRGNRTWLNAQAAEEELKRMRIKHDQMYDYSVISPATAEKRAVQRNKKGEVKNPDAPIGERQWTKLQALITQADGKPTVVPESDKRPAIEIKPVRDDFESLPETGEELV